MSGGLPPPPRTPNLVQTVVSQITSYIMSFNFLFYVEQLKNFTLRGPFSLGGGGYPSPKNPNLVQTIVSQITSYIIMSFNILCWAVKKFHFGRAIFLGVGRGSSLPKGTQICPKQLSHKQLLTLWVLTFYVEQFKNFTLEGPLLLEGLPPPPRTPNLAQTVVSQITFNIMSFNFLCWAVQNFHFGRAILFWGERGFSPQWSHK